jgi:hypothetical protein
MAGGLTSQSFTGPDPFTYRAVWGVPVTSRDAFDLLVARQLLWMPQASPDVRRMLFAEDGQPICPACGELVTTGTPAVVCVAVLADAALQAQIEDDPRIIATRDPDSLEAWWLVHGDCADKLTRERVHELNQRIELALRAATRGN